MTNANYYDDMPRMDDESDDDSFMSSMEVQKLSKDLRKASKTLSDTEARYLVNAYYSTQDMRKRYANQERAMEAAGEPHEMISWYTKQMTRMEAQIKISLDVFSYNHPVGTWMRANRGVGPVIAAGLLAHIDIHRAPTVGHIWRYAGLDPTVRWYGRGINEIISAARKNEKGNWEAFLWVCNAVSSKPSSVMVNATLIEKEAVPTVEQAQAYAISKGHSGEFKALFHFDNVLYEAFSGEKLVEAYKHFYPGVRLNWTKIAKAMAKRPWNSELKTLCWKIGDSFRKLSSGEKGRKPSPYGLLYRERKQREVERNDNGDFAEAALEVLTRKKIGKERDAYWWYSGEWTRNPKFNPALAAMVEKIKAEGGATDDEALEIALDKLKPELKPKLPPAHIDARAMRYAVKIFISHLHDAMYKRILKKNPPLPYPIAHLNHVHMIEPFLLDEELAQAAE
jgi:hypothetical protein